MPRVIWGSRRLLQEFFSRARTLCLSRRFLTCSQPPSSFKLSHYTTILTPSHTNIQLNPLRNYNIYLLYSQHYRHIYINHPYTSVIIPRYRQPIGGLGFLGPVTGEASHTASCLSIYILPHIHSILPVLSELLNCVDIALNYTNMFQSNPAIHITL